MKKHVFLSCLCLLLLVWLAAVPVLAATTVTCPSSCSCLLPAEAKKIGSPGYCQGQQKVCAYDSEKNEKYCYQKPVATTTPQLSSTGFKVVTTTLPTVAPQKCASGCTCMSSADGKGKGLLYCNGKQTVCGGTDKAPLYCFALPTTTTTKPISLVVTGFHVITTTPAHHEYSDNSFGNWSLSPIPCTAPCTCLEPDAAKDSGLSRCSVNATLVCGYSTAGKAEYCYTPDRPTGLISAAGTTITSTLPACPAGCACLATDKAEPSGYKPCSGVTAVCGNDPIGRAMYCYQRGKINAFEPVNALPTSQLIPAVISTTPTLPATSARTASPLDIIIALITGRSYQQSSTPSQRILCNGSLVNAWTDPANCGSCGAFCAEGLVCSMGQCTGGRDSAVYSSCGPFQIQCNGSCSNYLYDEENCGRCGNRCGAHETCCSGHCTDADNDPENCYSCGTVCGENATCSSGLCTCINSTIRCGTVCADPETSEEHCGGCNIRCGAGEACCAGHCIDVTRNGMNCGGCGNNCGTDIICRDSMCVDPETDEEHCGDSDAACDFSWGRCCNGVCVNTQSNPAHCWHCNERCDPGESCIYGRCVNLQTSYENCGSLGHRCSGWSHNTCCNGQCVDLDDDEHNCGHCGHRCPWYEECTWGSCCNRLYGGIPCE